MASATPAFALVDWGTTSFRLWLVDRHGAVMATSRGREGMMHAAEEGFESVLRRHLVETGAPAGVKIVICGMAGARQGWVEAPYVATPARPESLAERAVQVSCDLGDVRILPGVCQSKPEAPDVMRGEETQLIGLAGSTFDGIVCMPGTHSKWVRLENGAIAAFSTFMTGELFDVLGRHSILKHAVDISAEATGASGAFIAALERSLASPETSLSRIFGLRAGQLLGFSQHSDGAAELSGLLIGAEVGAALSLYPTPGEITLVASGQIAVLYETALRTAGLEVTRADAETMTQRGLLAAANRIWPKPQTQTRTTR